ncbi:cell wall / vacuolar inhibitor of fructosidase 2 [Cicer arietinum]|uniref:Cell wall / vacuolar inhibitor of fructosidase 2 n=1 Tax=Cicer arietinum TaxID=3827 RepID=A0A1S2YCS6_CICAR|nr:cell wall / vacuolar inhibitor of fructosidase 2 [Cicer arietinum]
MMTCKIFFSLFLLLFLSHPNLCTFVNGDATLIKNTCKNTKYYNLCFSSLKSDPSSPNADTKGLALIMVGIGMTNATSTSSYLSSKLLTPTNNTTLKRVLKECEDKYNYAGDALQASVQDLANEEYDYAYMHITAAKDYPNACHNAFKRVNDLVYPTELANRENGLKHICDVAMGIIDNLINW